MFRYSCFLSYQRGNDLLDRFIRELFQGLSDELGLVTSLPVWFDTARIAVGERWAMASAEALLRSVCMVPVLTPTYFSKQRYYCSREYLAMERIEASRSRATGRPESLILPVVLRGAEHLPKIVTERRQYLDFSQYLAFGVRQFRSPKFGELVSELARRVARLCELYTALEKSIDPAELQMALPSDEEASKWLDSATNTLRTALPAFPLTSQ